jgi:hypothetical protein
VYYRGPKCVRPRADKGKKRKEEQAVFLYCLQQVYAHIMWGSAGHQNFSVIRSVASISREEYIYILERTLHA